MTAIFGAKVSGVQRSISSHTCQSIVTEAPPPETQEISAPAERMYVLGVKDGRLAIYAADGYTLVDTLNTYVYSLPLSDREAVSEGIDIYSVNELVSLIEDYTS